MVAIGTRLSGYEGVGAGPLVIGIATAIDTEAMSMAMTHRRHERPSAQAE
jgi:hypothetical protein